MQLLDGKIVSAAIKEEIKSETILFKAETGVIPHLAAVLVGNDGASETYVASKMRSCEEVGFKSSLFRFDADASETEVMECIQKLNADNGVHGILVQLPLPRQINESKIINLIDANKDVDGFHPVNAGKLLLGEKGFVPATPAGVMMMLKYYGIKTTGKKAVVIGRSNIVGKPMSVLLARNGEPGNSTVTICHSRTENLANHTREADIIVAALGKPGFLTADMIKQDAIIIDVGITRVQDESKKSGFRLRGDVDFDDVADKASYITPVPGGVGLMTICALLRNTLEAATHASGTK